jgi:TrmH family RNA methyltransferase
VARWPYNTAGAHAAGCARRTMTHHSLRRIESDQNAVFKDLRRALSGRDIRKNGLVLVSGARNIRDVLLAYPDRCEAWVTCDGQVERTWWTKPTPPSVLPADAAWYQLSPRLFRELDIFGTHGPLVFMRTPPVEAWDSTAGLRPGCTLLVPFQAPENVGAVIRSAVAMGVNDVVLLEGCGNPYHPKAIRASAGAVFRPHLMRGPAMDDLPANITVIPLSAEGRDVAGVVFPERFALLPGAEGSGLPARFRADAVAIPMDGRVESLNAATAAAVFLYLWSRARR